MDVLATTLPIFALIGLGWLGTKLSLFDAQMGAGISRFVFWLAFPALLLTSMAKAPPPEANTAAQIGTWLAVLLGFQVLARLIGHVIGLDKESKAGAAMASTCGNTAFLGTAVLASLMGPSILPLVATFVAVENIVVVGLAVAGLKLTKEASGANARKITGTLLSGVLNPTSAGALIGFIISFSRHPLPAPIMRPLEMLGSAASPAGLVALGIVMAGLSADIGRYWRGTMLVVTLKNMLLPLAMLSAFTLMHAPKQVTIAATLLAACPSAVNVFIQARQADVWAKEAATAVFVTTLVSIIGVSLVAGLWGG